MSPSSEEKKKDEIERDKSKEWTIVKGSMEVDFIKSITSEMGL